MACYNYSYWYGSPEKCPALYINVRRIGDSDPFVNELIAAVDTGSPYTAIPLKYKNEVDLMPSRRGKVLWPGRGGERQAVYVLEVIVEKYKVREVEIVFDPYHEEYGLIGRNLLKYWYMYLNGPESRLEINEGD